MAGATSYARFRQSAPKHSPYTRLPESCAGSQTFKYKMPHIARVCTSNSSMACLQTCCEICTMSQEGVLITGDQYYTGERRPMDVRGRLKQLRTCRNQHAFTINTTTGLIS